MARSPEYPRLLQTLKTVPKIMSVFKEALMRILDGIEFSRFAHNFPICLPFILAQK